MPLAPVPLSALDRFGRVVDQWWLAPSTSTTISRFQYGYDDDGNVLYKNDLVTSSNSELYSYDNLNRLTSYEVGTLNSGHTAITGTPSDTWTTTLDGVGDRNSVTVNSTTTTSTFNSQNEQTGYGSATLAYDNAGNVTADQNGNSGYTYDAWGRLVYSSANDFTYDALGRRISAGTTEQLFYSNDGQVLEDRHTHSQSGGIVVDSIDRYVWGPSYVNQVVLQDHYDETTQATTRTYAMQDANYNAVVITNASGTVLDRFAYDQDGNLRAGIPSSDGWVILWQGMRQVTIGSGSATTNLFESQSRFENPQLGTWISPDPKQYIDGMNYYQIEIGNPVSLLDPSGNGTFGRIVGGIIGAIGGGIAGGIVGGSIDGAIGAAGGSVVPGAGTVAGGAAGLSWGAMTGGAAGAAGGWKAGGAVGSSVENWIVSHMTGGSSSGASGGGSSGSGSSGSSGQKCPRNKLPTDNSQLGHIFRDAEGHIADTAANRQLLEDVANDPNSTLGTDQFGNTWSARTQADGSQVWTQTRNGQVINGGVNQPPRVFNPQTGLSAPTKPGT